MLDDYKKAVIFNYRRKKEKRGLLSPNLIHPSPARLREECLVALESRTLKKDESFLKDFFNSGSETVDYSHAIRRFDVDRFRPLVNLLNDRIERPDPNNVELLAWLIGFEPRPYDHKIDYTKYLGNDEDEVIIDQPLTPFPEPLIEEPPTEPEPREESPNMPKPKPGKSDWKDKFKARKDITLIAAAFFFIVGGTYLYIDETKAFICKEGTGKKYHLSSKCPALKHCGNGMIQTTIAAAEKNGKTLCLFELK